MVDAVLLKPLPYPEPDRLAGIWHSAAGINLNEIDICASLYFTYRERSRTFERIGAYTGGAVSVTRVGEPERVQSLFVTQEVLPILGAQPALGAYLHARRRHRRQPEYGGPYMGILAGPFRRRDIGRRAGAT